MRRQLLFEISLLWVRLLRSLCPGSKVFTKKIVCSRCFGLGNANEAKFGAQTDGIILNIFKGN